MRLDFILAPIKRETGVDICLYTLDGEPEGSTGADLEYVSLRLDDFTEGVRTDAKAGRTYFIAGERHKVFGVIDGAGKEYRNYAVMIKRIVENELASLSLPDFNERMRLLLSGTANETQIVSLKANFSEPLNYYMFALMCAPAKQVSLLAFMRAFKENGDILVRIDEGTIAYARACGADDEYQSANEFATVLQDNLSEELPFEVKICIGEVVRKFEDFEPSFSHAMFACRYGKLIDPTASVYSYKDYVLIKLLSELPREKLTRYRAMLLDKGFEDVLKDEELMSTAEMFMKNSLNVSETSRMMYMHRNTLMYRLDKIERATGLNIRNFSDAFTFRMLTLIQKLSSDRK